MLGLMIGACAPVTLTSTPVMPAVEAVETRPALPLPTLAPSPMPMASPTLTSLPPTQTPVPHPGLCSPLQDIPQVDLPALVSNPYHPPPPGSDDPHHGVDLAVRLAGGDMAVSGHVVQAAFTGKAAMVLRDRFPYGNALLVETELEIDSIGNWWQPAGLPAPAPTLALVSPLTCPSLQLPQLDLTRRSLYVLYAHLLEPPDFQVGDQVTCGQVIGQVGSSGNALNPHLHFETRAGPSGMQFSGMAHYDNSATPLEMGSYCLWRISGLFQLVDPMSVLRLPSQ